MGGGGERIEKKKSATFWQCPLFRVSKRLQKMGTVIKRHKIPITF